MLYFFFFFLTFSNSLFTMVHFLIKNYILDCSLGGCALVNCIPSAISLRSFPNASPDFSRPTALQDHQFDRHSSWILFYFDPAVAPLLLLALGCSLSRVPFQELSRPRSPRPWSGFRPWNIFEYYWRGSRFGLDRFGAVLAEFAKLAVTTHRPSRRLGCLD